MKDKHTDIPFIYDTREPHPKDRRDYPDYKLEDVRIINLNRDGDIKNMHQAEKFLYDHYRFDRLIEKRTTARFFTFKVVGHDNGG